MLHLSIFFPAKGLLLFSFCSVVLLALSPSLKAEPGSARGTAFASLESSALRRYRFAGDLQGSRREGFDTSPRSMGDFAASLEISAEGRLRRDIRLDGRSLQWGNGRFEIRRDELPGGGSGCGEGYLLFDHVRKVWWRLFAGTTGSLFSACAQVFPPDLFVPRMNVDALWPCVAFRLGWSGVEKVSIPVADIRAAFAKEELSIDRPLDGDRPFRWELRGCEWKGGQGLELSLRVDGVDGHRHEGRFLLAAGRLIRSLVERLDFYGDLGRFELSPRSRSAVLRPRGLKGHALRVEWLEGTPARVRAVLGDSKGGQEAEVTILRLRSHPRVKLGSHPVLGGPLTLWVESIGDDGSLRLVLRHGLRLGRDDETLSPQITGFRLMGSFGIPVRLDPSRGRLLPRLALDLSRASSKVTVERTEKSLRWGPGTCFELRRWAQLGVMPGRGAASEQIDTSSFDHLATAGYLVMDRRLERWWILHMARCAHVGRQRNEDAWARLFDDDLLLLQSREHFEVERKEGIRWGAAATLLRPALPLRAYRLTNGGPRRLPIPWEAVEAHGRTVLSRRGDLIPPWALERDVVDLRRSGGLVDLRIRWYHEQKVLPFVEGSYRIIGGRITRAEARWIPQG